MTGIVKAQFSSLNRTFMNCGCNLPVRKGRIPEYDIVRLLACFLVVIGHALYREPVKGTTSVAVITYASGLAHAFHMPLFFLLAGACASLSSLSISIKMIKKRAFRLLLPYYVLGFVFLIPLLFLCSSDTFDMSRLWELCVDHLTFQHGMHTWFLPALFMVSMLTALIHRLVSPFISPAVVLIALSGTAMLLVQYLLKTTSFVPALALKGYWFWYVCGVYFLPPVVLWQPLKERTLAMALGGTLSFFLVVYIVRDVFGLYQLSLIGADFVFYVVQVVSGSLSCVLLAKVLAKTTLVERTWFEAFSAGAMTIYLYHYPFIWVVERLVRHHEWIHSASGSFVYCLVQTVGVTLASMAVWFFLRTLKTNWRCALGG